MERDESHDTAQLMGRELATIFKNMDAWRSQVERVLSDTAATAVFIRVSSQEGVKEILERSKILEGEDLFVKKVRDAQQEELSKCEQVTSEAYKNLEDLHEHTTKLFQLKADREALISNSMSAVKFLFTNVDPRDADHVFSFSIRMDKSTASWTLVDCKPWVEAAPSFVETLKRSNELSRFVSSMRREFEVLAVRSRYLVT